MIAKGTCVHIVQQGARTEAQPIEDLVPGVSVYHCDIDKHEPTTVVTVVDRVRDCGYMEMVRVLVGDVNLLCDKDQMLLASSLDKTTSRPHWVLASALAGHCVWMSPSDLVVLIAVSVDDVRYAGVKHAYTVITQQGSYITEGGFILHCGT